MEHDTSGIHSPALNYILSKIKTDTAVFNKVRERFQSDLVVRGSGGTKLENIVRENRAIQSVLHSNRELLVDPVALREAKITRCKLPDQRND